MNKLLLKLTTKFIKIKKMIENKNFKNIKKKIIKL